MRGDWTPSHSTILAEAFAGLLGPPARGAVAFVRCLDRFVVERLAADTASFAISGWDIFLVTGRNDPATRCITADRAVEIRESKGPSTLFLVDTGSAGAGMDGVYSSAREVHEAGLFERATRLAGRRLDSDRRRYVVEAIRRARERGLGVRVSPWQRLDYYAHVVHGECPGSCLDLIGLWPVAYDEAAAAGQALDVEDLQESRRFVDRLLDPRVADLAPSQRVDSLRLLHPTQSQRTDLTRFLRRAASIPVSEALKDLRDAERLWVNSLRTERAAQGLLGITVDGWRGKTHRILKWSGLKDRGDNAPQLVLPRDEDVGVGSAASKVEVRWKARPDGLGKGAVDYRVEMLGAVTDNVLASQDLPHTGKAKQKAIFTPEDLHELGEGTTAAKIRVSARGSKDGPEGPEGPDDSPDTANKLHTAETEEFEIVFGEVGPGRAAAGKRYRTFSDGLIDLPTRDAVTAMASLGRSGPTEAKGNFLVWRSPDERRNFRVYRPPLLRDVERQWAGQAGVPGRWRIRVRMSGKRVGDPEFVALDRPEAVDEALWARAMRAGRGIVRLYAGGPSAGDSGKREEVGGAGQVYDSASAGYRRVEEYLRAWIALLQKGGQSLALTQTVEVLSQAGDLVGLIVLPGHPLRMAWHAAYDNLVLHAVFAEGAKPGDVRKELAGLDGAVFPAFLPGVDPGRSFVFGDTLGFHAVGMVADGDPEPKGTLSILHRALTGKDDHADAAGPTVGAGSAEILGAEIRKYVEGHSTAHTLHVHALRAGDGRTVVQALGEARKTANGDGTTDTDHQDDRGGQSPDPLAYVLQIHPSPKQRKRGIAGRFISEAQEKRRRRAGTVDARDRWMLESQERPGGIRIPNLRWARKESLNPDSAAHVALAFDTFRSEVKSADAAVAVVKPFHAYGLLSFFDRRYRSSPNPLWQGVVPDWKGGESHPDARAHTLRLQSLQAAIHRLVATNLDVKAGADSALPALVTEISPDAADSLDRLHGLSDWVVTLDRNAGLEYFDSPRDDPETYEKFVIDCVPERDDLGSLRLITSTSDLDEVQDLAGRALDDMGLVHSRRGADFLMSNLKALSGRLAIRLTGGRSPASELVALAMSRAHCRNADEQGRAGRAGDHCWASLETGFFVPVDDIRDLFPSDVLPPGRDETGRPRVGGRPDLIHVGPSGGSRLSFRFVEVKYRRHLRAARSPQLVEDARKQTESLSRRWLEWFGSERTAPSLRATRLARLARILHFYADKARRHGLPAVHHQALAGRIDKMVEEGGKFRLEKSAAGNRGWVFCPEYRNPEPTQISPEDWDEDVRVFLFGPAGLPWGPAGPESPDGGRSGPGPAVGDETRPTRQLGLGDALSQKRQSGKTGSAKPTPNASSTPESTPPSAPAKAPSIILGTDKFRADAKWDLTVKGNPHLLIAGLPGMGKTTCLLNLCKQMMGSGVLPIVFSYHQDIDERLELLERPRAQSADPGSPSAGVDDRHPPEAAVRYVDFDGLGFNPLQVLDRSWKSAHMDIAGIVRDIFMAIYPNLGELQGGKIRTAVKQSFEELGWGAGADVESLSEPPFRRFLEILKSDPRPDIGLRNLLTRLDELDDYGFFGVGTEHGSLWDSDRPTVIRIHRTKNDVLQNAFASLLLYGLYKHMFQRGIRDRITHAVIFDEAHRAAKLSLIPTMAKESRKYGVSLVLASQQATDFHTSVFSAIANYLVLRMTEADARTLVRNVASSAQQRTLVDQIKQMDRFKALYFSSQGAKPERLALPDFSPAG